MTFGKLAPTLFELGYPVIPVSGKVPTQDAWEQEPITNERVAYWANNGQTGHNIGLRTGDESVGGVALSMADIDIYDVTVARAVCASVIQTFGATIERRGQAPKRGLIYAQDKPFTKFNSPIWTSPDGVNHKFEWLGKGQQFVAFGTHPDTKRPYTYADRSLADIEPWEFPVVTEEQVRVWMTEVLPTLIPADWTVKGSVRNGTAVVQPADPDERALLNFKPKLDCTLDELRDALSAIDPDTDYDGWIAIGMALHHQTDGSDEGYEVWAEHSRRSPKHVEKTTLYKWKKLKSDPSRGEVITAASIFKLARQNPDYVASQDRVRDESRSEATVTWSERIAAANDEHTLERLVKREIAADTTLGTIDRAKLEQAVKTRFLEFNVNLPIAQIRKMLSPSRTGSGMVERPENADEWCQGYVWCTAEDSFINIHKQKTVSIVSFNAAHGRDVKGVWLTHEGVQMTAHHVALQEIQIPVVDMRMYLPWAGQFFNMDGLDYLNQYRLDSFPDAVPSTDWSPEGQITIGKLEAHIRTLCGTEADHLLKWMAYSVQNPGKKIRHSILIKGTEGDGKSLIGSVLEMVMGSINVNKVSPQLVNGNFNGWAQGGCICIVEELRMTGHSRYDTANNLKELHTNDRVTIHMKGRDSFVVYNTQNYICFTNYSDAVPLNDSDRRYFVIFSPFSDAVDLAAAGLGADYFASLFDLIRDNAGALRGWLMEMDLTGFNPNGRAPGSAGKSAMVAAATHDDDEVIQTLVDDAMTPGVSRAVISTVHLTRAMRASLMDEPDLEIPTKRALGAILGRLGYVKKSSQVWWDGERCRVWLKNVKHIEDVGLIKTLLDRTKNDNEF